MNKKILLFSFLYVFCYNVGLYYSMKSDFGFSLLFCTELMCDFKYPYILPFLVFLGVFIFKVVIFPSNFSFVKRLLLSVAIAVLILFLNSFLLALFYMIELHMMMSYEIGFQVVLFSVRLIILLSLLSLTRSIINKVYRPN
jgi:hypothetical protein